MSKFDWFLYFSGWNTLLPPHPWGWSPVVFVGCLFNPIKQTCVHNVFAVESISQKGYQGRVKNFSFLSEIIYFEIVSFIKSISNHLQIRSTCASFAIVIWCHLLDGVEPNWNQKNCFQFVWKSLNQRWIRFKETFFQSNHTWVFRYDWLMRFSFGLKLTQNESKLNWRFKKKFSLPRFYNKIWFASLRCTIR